jgi:hypothetical protein
METDLKKENSKSIFLIMAASLVLSAFFQFDSTSVSGLIELLVIGSGSLMFSVVLVMLANVLPQNIKHKLIFTRLKNELPACRVDQLCRKDSRVEYEVVEKRWPEVFLEEIDGATRNSRWYKQIYKPVKDMHEVLQAHRSFLLYRDAFTGVFLILLTTLIWSLLGDPKFIGEIRQVVFFMQGVLVVLSLIAARIAGNRFVVNAVSAAD